MPQTTQAFTLDAYADSNTTDALMTPTPAFGQSAPANWGQGYKAWRQEWRIRINRIPPPPPATSWMSPGVRVLKLSTKNPQPNYFQAPGNPLTINFWDFQQTSQVTNGFVAISGFYTDNSGQRQYCSPPFSAYAWNCYSWPPASPITFPAGNIVTLSQASDAPAAIPMASNSVVDPSTQQIMYVGGLITLLFNGSITPPAPGVNSIGVGISVYFTLTNNSVAKQFYADPELDVDCSGEQSESMVKAAHA